MILALLAYAGHKRGMGLSSMFIAFSVMIPILMLLDLLPAVIFDIWLLGIAGYVAFYLVRSIT